MRIVAGKFRGRALHSPTGADTRPAMAKTKEALFSMLDARGIDWSECRVLDLFAGTGSLAFEAISRGAISATLLETDDAACKAIAKNAQMLGLTTECKILKQDVLRFLRNPPPYSFNLIFIDPPYRRNLGQRTLTTLSASGILAPRALIAAEIESGTQLIVPDNFNTLVERQFGQTCLHLWESI